MSLQRMVGLAVFCVLGAAPFSVSAQALMQPSAVPAAASFDGFVPAFLSESNSTVAALAPDAPQASDSALDRALNFDAVIDAAAVAEVLSKAPRKHLADLAMRLRDIRYRRGGHEPSTGFDCSGFVHYVYHQTFGLDLPFDAPGQFVRGETVARDEMKTGDLVFFGNGKRIQHVGIYLGNGRFIHSPSPASSGLPRSRSASSRR